MVIICRADTCVEVGLLCKNFNRLMCDGVDPEADGGGHAVHEHEACQALFPIYYDLGADSKVYVLRGS